MSTTRRASGCRIWPEKLQGTFAIADALALVSNSKSPKDYGASSFAGSPRGQNVKRRLHNHYFDGPQ